jgi:hypothetical protein
MQPCVQDLRRQIVVRAKISSENDFPMIPEVADPSQNRSLIRGRSRFREKILNEQSEHLALEKADVNNCRNWPSRLCSFNRLAFEDWLNGVRV